MDLKLVLHRTSIKSGKRSRVKNQSFKKDKLMQRLKFPTSLKSSIHRDEDLMNIYTHILSSKRPTLCAKRRIQNINNLENSFNSLYLRILKCLRKTKSVLFALYCEYL